MNETKRGLFVVVKMSWLLLFVILALPPSGLAADGSRLWDSEGMPATQATDDQVHVRLTTDRAGGAILVWQDLRDGNWDIYAQRLDSDGNPLWTLDGVAIATGIDRQVAPEITHDGAGGAVITWWHQDGTDPLNPWRVFAQRINVNGVAQWTANGVPVSTDVGIKPTVTPLNPLSITSDTAGGAFIAFDASAGPRVVRIDGNGVLVGPGLNGVDLGEGVMIGGGLFTTDDGTGGAIVAWANNFKNIVTQRLTPDLSRPWGTTPVVISSDPRRESHPHIASDGSGGALITWVRQPEVGNPPYTQVVVQRIDAGGNPLWTPGGVVLVDSGVVGGSSDAWADYEVMPVVAPDGSGGAIVAWNDWRNEPGTGGNDDIFAQWVDTGGAPQWTPNGVSLHPYPGGSQRRPQIVSDGAGGAIVVLQDKGLGSWDIYAVGLDAGGTAWTSYVFYDGFPSETDQTDPRVVFDGTGPDPTGAVIAWDDERGTNADIYAQKVEVAVPNTPTGTNVEVDAGSGVTVTFEEVSGSGNTTATEVPCSAPAPGDYSILPLGDPTCYDVETTASYSGTVTVCINYDDTGVTNESALELRVYEDPPGEWMNITTTIDAVNNIICGEKDYLSHFAVMLWELAPPIDRFDFNDGTTQGWTLQGAFDENGNGPFSSSFYYGWKDYVNYPNPPGGDPPGDNNGSIQLFTTGGHGIDNPGATWWVMQFHSPDLSSSDTWQAARGYSVQIAECMAVMTSLYSNLYVKVYDIDQDRDRYFYSGSAQELEHDIYGDDIANWNLLTFDWSGVSGFPTNYVLREVFVNIWGRMAAYFEGGVYLDEVIPIPGVPPGPDFDGDGDVDGSDLATFAAALGSISGDPNYNPHADFDADGDVDENDLAVFAAEFGRTDRGPIVYFADADETPGSVYKIENGTESTYYTRGSGQLFNFAFSAKGILYYSNANDYDLYMLKGGVETLVYHHNTYLQDVAFDSKGRIYFSEAYGGGAPGYIYLLEDGVISVYYTVALPYVGFWAGDFAFDQKDNLYLSNGNRAGAHIYKVVDGVPEIVFSAPGDEPIKGICFDSAGNLFYASWIGGNIFQVDLITGERQLFYSNPDHYWLSDVFAADRPM